MRLVKDNRRQLCEKARTLISAPPALCFRIQINLIQGTDDLSRLFRTIFNRLPAKSIAPYFGINGITQKTNKHWGRKQRERLVSQGSHNYVLRPCQLANLTRSKPGQRVCKRIYARVVALRRSSAD